jgi:cytoskeletal protein RodZ
MQRLFEEDGVVAFGLILALVGIGGGILFAWLALQSDSAITLQGAGMSVTVLPITMFVAGAGSMLLLWLGWRLMRIGSRRRRAQREEIDRLRSTSAAQTQAPRGGAAPAPAEPTQGAATSTAPTTGTGDRAAQTVEAAPARPAAAPTTPTSTSTPPAGTESATKSTSPPARAAERQVRGPMD